MKFFAVTGTPILHSKSPEIFNSLFQQNKIDAKYTRLISASGKDAIFLFKELGLSGMSVTAPLKEEIIPYLDDLDTKAREIGSVNTVLKKDGKIIGYNTDYYGIINTLKDVRDKKVLLLGAGGAAKAVAYSVIEQGAELTVYNRTEAKSKRLAQKYDTNFCKEEDLQAEVQKADIIVNTLPSGVKVLEDDWIKPEHTFLDAVYHNSVYEAPAQEKGSTFFWGKDWLINQAIPAFRLFMGYDDDKEIVFEKPSLEGSIVKDKIAFVGFMGTGKSMLGHKVSEALNCRYLCSDTIIAEREKRSIDDIFNEKGEPYFRQVETEVLNMLSSMVGKAVVSSGGGMVLDADNRKLIAKHFISICLYSSPQSIILNVDPQNRPLLKHNFKLEAVQELLAERNPSYLESADIIINTGQKNSEKLVQTIVEELKGVGYSCC